MSNEFMQADAALTRDLEKATSPDDLRQLLHNAVARSAGQLGIERDERGQFVRRNPLTPANQEVEPAEERVFTKTVKIAGKDFDFSDGTAEGLESQIASAKSVAEQLQADAQATPRSRRTTLVDEAQEMQRQQDLKTMFQVGGITASQYLIESGELDRALAAKGFDIERAGNEQTQQSWAQATNEWLESEAGADWPGGNRNLQIIGAQIVALGLTGDPSPESLTKAWEAMKEKNTFFNSDTSDEQLLRETEGMTPQEILEKFKQAHGGDSDAANQGFIEAHRGGRISSGMFGK